VRGRVIGEAWQLVNSKLSRFFPDCIGKFHGTALGFGPGSIFMTTHQLLLFFHLLMIALGIGLSASNVINVRLALPWTGEMALGLGLQRRTIGQLGDKVILLIWISGALLLWQSGMAGMPKAFHIKLLFVVLLTVFHALARMTGEKMRMEGTTVALPRLGWFVLLGWLSAVAALFCAVWAFAA
jgi:hypothetical protein